MARRNHLANDDTSVVASELTGIMSRLIWFLGLAIAVIAVLSFDKVSPGALTDTRMHMMKRRVLRFANVHGVLPKTIDEFPHIEGFDNEVSDGWGRRILSRIEGDKVFLTSYGRDGVPGGSGLDTDRIRVFLAKTGAWAEELCEWETDPYGGR
jgi:hypothetical protein